MGLLPIPPVPSPWKKTGSGLKPKNETTRSFLAGSVTTTQRDALTAENGMMVYNTTTSAFNIYENGSWTTMGGGGAGSDTTAIHDNTASEISAITEKTAPVGADIVIIEDSANSNNKKKVQFTNFLNFGIDGGAFNDTFVSTVPVNGGAFV